MVCLEVRTGSHLTMFMKIVYEIPEETNSGARIRIWQKYVQHMSGFFPRAGYIFVPHTTTAILMYTCTTVRIYVRIHARFCARHFCFSRLLKSMKRECMKLFSFYTTNMRREAATKRENSFFC